MILCISCFVLYLSTNSKAMPVTYNFLTCDLSKISKTIRKYFPTCKLHNYDRGEKMSNNLSVMVSLFIIYFNIISNCKGILFHLTPIPDGGVGGIVPSAQKI